MTDEPQRPRRVMGSVLIAAGAVWFVAMLVPGFFDIRILGPLVFIAVGGALLVQGARS